MGLFRLGASTTWSRLSHWLPSESYTNPVFLPRLDGAPNRAGPYAPVLHLAVQMHYTLCAAVEASGGTDDGGPTTDDERPRTEGQAQAGRTGAESAKPEHLPSRKLPNAPCRPQEHPQSTVFAHRHPRKAFGKVTPGDKLD